jgi:hypothetical protein
MVRKLTQTENMNSRSNTVWSSIFDEIRDREKEKDSELNERRHVCV